jgi:hypothetical protein
VGYHSWVVSTKDEEIIISGGGPDDGAPHQMMSYLSELGGICAGMAVIETMTRSGNINIKSVKIMCENETSVKRCNQKQTNSVLHNTEGDWDLVSTYRDLKKQWYGNIDISVSWAKGHADQEGRTLTKYDRLNV